MIKRSIICKLLLCSALIMSFTSCIINDVINDTSIRIDAGTDPNFKIVVNTDAGFEHFNRKIIVFEIPIYAFSNVEDDKLIHTANILAQYLDNNEDDIVDNLTVHTQLKTNNTFLFLWKTERDAFIAPSGSNSLNISADSINLIWHTNGHTGDFDYSLETAWNLLVKNGFEISYPTIFSDQANSEISIEMDAARGENFLNPPATYPVAAWFSNTDVSCNYMCQIGKYNFWVMSSMLGLKKIV